MACCERLFEAIINSKMDQIQLGNQTIRFNRESTMGAYSAIEKGGAEKCGCTYCQNFAAQRAVIYPERFRLLLDQLGIDHAKEGEVYECGLVDDKSRAYGGWFYFAGELPAPSERFTDAASSFQYWVADAKRLPRPPVDFGKSVLALQFFTKLPWVIADQP
jgi:hypothetical protein